MPSPPRSSATTAGPGQFYFVTALHPNDFKAKDTMTRVRRQVMTNFLTTAEQDSNTTDIRITRKRNPARMAAPTSDSSANADATPAMATTPPSALRDSSFNLAEVPGLYWPMLNPLLTSPIALTGFDPSQHSADPDAEEKLFRRFPPPPGPPDSISASRGPDTPQEPSASDINGTSLMPMPSRSGRVVYDVAYTRPYGLRYREVAMDPFAWCAPLSNRNINLELLKYNCTAYFATYSLAQHWGPLLLTSLPAFLSSLCVSAPYTDIMLLAKYGQDQPFKANRFQTMELLGVLPSLISNSLALYGSNDANIVTVTHLLEGSLSTDDTSHVMYHQSRIKDMIKERGGLQNLRGLGWALPVIVSITNIMASYIRNEKADPEYVDYASTYAREHPQQRRLVPESPLFSKDDCLTVVSSSEKCNKPTVQLLHLAYNLTTKFVELGRLEARQKAQIGPIMLPDDTGMAAIKSQIEQLVTSIHEMPTANAHGHPEPKDYYYEAIRLAALLYCHAIWHRVPFHEAPNVTCTIRCAEDCKATPEMVQKAVAGTNLSEMWDRMAGTLFWVLLVAGAACHDPSNSNSAPSSSSTPDPLRSNGPRQRKMTSQAAPGRRPHQRSHSGPAAPRPRALAPPTSTPHDSMANVVESSGRQLPIYMSANRAGWSKAPAPIGRIGQSQSLPTSSSPDEGEAPSKRHRRSQPSSGFEGRIVAPGTGADGDYARKYLVGNAVRCCVLMEFEHTAAVIRALVRLDELRGYLECA